MAKYISCPWCGSHLDFGEKCDCKEEKEKRNRCLSELLSVEPNGQMCLKEAAAC